MAQQVRCEDDPRGPLRGSSSAMTFTDDYVEGALVYSFGQYYLFEEKYGVARMGGLERLRFFTEEVR